jgi:FkbM family methyltransferase
MIKKLLFKIFKYTSKFISGYGIGKLPFAPKLYQILYKNFKPKGVVKVKAGGHTMFVDSHDSALAPYLIMHGSFDPEETFVLEKFLKNGMTFIDVGANVGYFSLIAARLVGEDGKVFAFEPDEDNFRLLERNIQENGYKNIKVFMKAISDEVGTARFYLDSENLCAHSLNKKENSNFVEVETTILDELLKNEKVDVIKIDVEGAEQSVFDGMKDIIAKNNKLAVITEFYPKAIRNFGNSPKEYLKSFIDAGFKLYRVKGKEFININESQIDSLSRGEGMEKLINIVCLKNYN